jgi:hypothetical protein
MTFYDSFSRVQRRQDFERRTTPSVRWRNVIEVEGSGRFSPEQVVEFEVAFRNKPDLSFLVEEIEWGNKARPVVSVGVREWLRDDGGNYVGAKIWLGVT